LLKREDFGRPLQEDTEWLDPWLEKITAGISDPLLQAKAVLLLSAGNISTCTNHL